MGPLEQQVSDAMMMPLAEEKVFQDATASLRPGGTLDPITVARTFAIGLAGVHEAVTILARAVDALYGNTAQQDPA